MIRYENECCDCATGAYPCMGNQCPNLHVPHYYCDECGEEDTLYEYDGRELCADCLLNAVPVVRNLI